MTPQDIEARLIHRDGLMLILDKPAGLPVHRGPKGGPTFEDDFCHLRFGLPRDPALAHRLDKDTSGCLVLGRHRKALEKLMLLFKRGKISKTYWAVVRGGPAEDQGMIDLAMAPRDKDRGWWMKIDPAGQPARTEWRVLGRGMGADGAPLSWLALKPLTGRTHQLRLHCSASGFPILGDPIYGANEPRDAQLHLHARAIKIPISANKPPVLAEAFAPEHMKAALKLCGWRQEIDDALAAARAATEAARWAAKASDAGAA